ncbi:hypothetical protein GCM10023187_07750 [Nibrella viscosa]|uniref:TIR domain-containing protein n=1 Tax=Nibrella viscosa TaxID=1084524 RepID=A0ABP8JZ57_9BACT
MKDFFISYNQHDRTWAEWIAWQLEEAGYSVVIQAWDFTGNWIIDMNKAMVDTARTVAVLSPQYLSASYTHTEWANAFRLDPTGEKGLLIPVRVADFAPVGILAQLVYIDFVGQSEETAKERLLQRVRGERGKPGRPPVFPGGQVPAHRLITQKPPFPAREADEAQRRKVRDIVLHWRGLYATRVGALRRAAEQCRDWMEQPPVPFADELIAVLALADSVALDFRQLDLTELEYARAYGLRIHQTVFWGQATTEALSWGDLIDPEKRARWIADSDIRREFDIDDQPGRYGFELLARLLEAALALAQFDISSLPGGYLTGPDLLLPDTLSRYDQLIIASWDDKPGLHVLAAKDELSPLGSLFARNLFLEVLDARRNTEGSLDVLAKDEQHLYYWSRSGQQPVMQFANEPPVLCGAFLSNAPEADAVVINTQGDVLLLSIDGRTVSKPGLLVGTPSDAHCWIDPLTPENWYALALTWEHPFTAGMQVVSGLHGFAKPVFSAPDLWNQASLYPSGMDTGGKDPSSLWNSLCSLTLTTLDGLPCAVVGRQDPWGTGLCFLEPRTLTQVRRPLRIPAPISGVVIAAGRWLVVTLTQRGSEVRDRIMVWDLRAGHDEPVGSWLAEKGDVDAPIIGNEDLNSFDTWQVLRQFDPGSDANFQLCRFRWPSGTVDHLKRFRRLYIWPVAG